MLAKYYSDLCGAVYIAIQGDSAMITSNRTVTAKGVCGGGIRNMNVWNTVGIPCEEI